jgi:hypothetical protein
MIPTMLVVGLALGLLPRRWPHSGAVAGGLAVLSSLGFGLVVGEPAYGGALALANAAVGLGLGRAVQWLLPASDRHRRAA